MEFLNKLWTEHRTLAIILGLVLLPLTLLLIGIKLYMAFQVNAAHKEVEKAKSEDKKLEAEEDALKKQADDSMKVADQAAQRIEDRKDSGTDLDWNKKRDD